MFLTIKIMIEMTTTEVQPIIIKKNEKKEELFCKCFLCQETNDSLILSCEDCNNKIDKHTYNYCVSYCNSWNKLPKCIDCLRNIYCWNKINKNEKSCICRICKNMYCTCDLCNEY
jgi:hypothetical protein